ncbi:MAG: HAD-IA family hydrolase [Chloroflexi bacterium]|nr:HAD-IA family hydrolase [Chloroflexota bacterium]
MNSKYKSLGIAIQERREQCGLTQDELSDRAGLAYSTLAKIERGVVKNPSVFTVSSLAQALGCTVEELLKTQPVRAPRSSGIDDTFLFCDLNGVIVRFFHKAFVQLAHDNHLTVDRVETAFWHYNDAANKGEMNPRDFNAAMSEYLGIPRMDWHSNYLASVEPINEMHECLRSVIKTNRVGILSNIHEGLIGKMLKDGRIPDLDYACIVDSSEVHAIKPEQRMYEIAEQMAGASGEDILFVDDSRANLIAAERLGWRGLWFDDYRPADSVARLKEALDL